MSVARLTGLSAASLTLGLSVLLLGAGAPRATPLEPEVLRSLEPAATSQPATVSASAAAAGQLVEQGRNLFLDETFAGNGRTCATCHRPDNNYTLDAAYIATLPSRDPLFVAERVPALRNLERPRVLRELGLVAVNVDGFGRPAVLRAVPHLLGLRHTTRVKPGDLTLPGTSRDLKASLGWSGDGAPGAGTLRLFAAAAVAQHMPKTLARRPGVDFRLPTGGELDALEAFLLSLGRPAEIDVSSRNRLRFTSAAVELGRELFHSDVSGPCSSCHRDAGALSESGFNENTDIGVIQRPNPPMRVIDPGVPGDGGFGASPTIEVAGGLTGRGDGRFSPPSLIEAGDTTPLFHDHSAPSLEAAVFFYTSPVFATSPEGRARAKVELKRPDVAAIAAFLRTLNAMENIRAGNALLDQVIGRAAAGGSSGPLALAIGDTEDAIRVLSGGAGLYRDSVRLLEDALALERQAAGTAGRPARDTLLRRAVVLMKRARDLMIVA